MRSAPIPSHPAPPGRRLARVAGTTAVVGAALVLLFATADRAAAAPTTKISGSVAEGTLSVTGSNGADNIALFLRIGNPATLEVLDLTTSVTLDFDRTTFDEIHVATLGGDDTVRIEETGGVFTDTDATTIDGGSGDDTLLGGSGNETFVGGAGNDTVRGGRGNDVALLGDGNDTFTWDPGDASDVVEGESGTDALDFDGSNASEHIDVSANGSRVRFSRDVANITMDLNGVERVNVNASGGTDTVTVNDLSGTDVTDVNTDLAGFPGSGTGDGAADNVIVNGTAANDTFSATGTGGETDITGGAAAVHVVGAELALDTVTVDGLVGNDQFIPSLGAGNAIGIVFDGGADDDTVTANGTRRADTIGIARDGSLVGVFDVGGGGFATDAENLHVNGLGGDDLISAGNGLAGLTQLTIDGGRGADRIIGGDGADVLFGGPGRDVVDGGRGNDVAFLGDGADTFVWDPGDGSDIVEGENGSDTLQFNGSNIGENVTLSANGPRLLFTRDVANIAMDVDGVEKVAFNAIGGADVVTVNDLTGTTVRSVAIDLANPPGSGAGDGAADDVVVNGTDGDDTVRVVSDNGAVKVAGLEPTVVITGGEVANDRLDLDTRAGADRVRSRLTPSDIPLFVNVPV